MSHLRVRLSLPLALLAVFIALAGGSAAQAQTRRLMSLTDLASIPRITDVQLSPDGRFVSYMLAQVDWKADALVRRHIWRQSGVGRSAGPVDERRR